MNACMRVSMYITRNKDRLLDKLRSLFDTRKLVEFAIFDCLCGGFRANLIRFSNVALWCLCESRALLLYVVVYVNCESVHKLRTMDCLYVKYGKCSTRMGSWMSFCVLQKSEFQIVSKIFSDIIYVLEHRVQCD